MTGHCGPAGQNRPALKSIDSYWQSIPLITLVPAPIADVTQATSLSYSSVAGDWPRPCLGAAKGEGLGDRNLRERVTGSGCGARSSPGVRFRVAHLPSSALAPWLCSWFSYPFWCRVSSWEALREARGRGDPARARLLAGAAVGAVWAWRPSSGFWTLIWLRRSDLVVSGAWQGYLGDSGAGISLLGKGA